MKPMLWALVLIVVLAIAVLANDAFGWWNPPDRLAAWLSAAQGKLDFIALAGSLLLAIAGAAVALGNGVGWWSVSWLTVSALFVPIVLMLAWFIVGFGSIMTGENWH